MGKVYKYNPKKKSIKVSTFNTKKSAQVNNRQLTKKIKQVINKDKESKWVQGSTNTLPDFTANQGKCFNITENIGQGDSVNGRDGDDIFLTFLKLGIKLSWDADVGYQDKYNFRVLLVRSNTNVSTGTTMVTANLPTNRQLVHSLIDNPDKNISVLYDKIHTFKAVPDGTTGRATSQNGIIRITKKLFYRMNYAEGLTYSIKPKSNLLLYILCDRTTTTSTAIDSDLEWLVGFKDV